jgi:hypothetical protein
MTDKLTVLGTVEGLLWLIAFVITIILYWCGIMSLFWAFTPLWLNAMIRWVVLTVVLIIKLIIYLFDCDL